MTVYSQTLKNELEVLDRDGLPGIRLMPSDNSEEPAYVLHAHESPRESGVQDFSLVMDDEESVDPDVPEDGDKENKKIIVEEDCLGYVPLADSKIKVMSRGLKKQLQNAAEVVSREDYAMWATLRKERPSRRNRALPRGCKTFIMELFAGAATLSVILASWGLQVAEPIDYLYNKDYDLLKPSVRKEISKRIEDEDPFLLSISPVCGPWSSFQNINLAKGGETEQKILDDRRKWYPVLSWVADEIRKRLAKGREVQLEHPWGSLLWQLNCMEKLMNEQPFNVFTGEFLELIKLDQCQYGLVDKDTGLPHRKSTGLLCSSSWMKQRLQKLCDGQHAHVHIEGGNKSKSAEQWPYELCYAMACGAYEEMLHGEVHLAFAVELEDELQQEQGLLDGVFTEEDLAPASKRRRLDPAELEREENIVEGSLPDSERVEDLLMKQEADRKAGWLRLPREKRMAMRRLRNMTGHCSHAALLRMLKASVADKDVLDAVKFFQCQVCKETAKEEDPAVAKPSPPSYEQRFNFEISLDAFEVHDAAGHRHTILSIIDLATRFHIAGRVAGGGVPSSNACAKLLNDSWIQWAGAPTYVVADQGVHNRGKMLALLLSHGVQIRQTAAHAPHQLGVGERQGGLVKQVMKKAIHQRQLVGAEAIQLLCAESARVKNNLLNHGGYSPTQWVMGFQPLDPTSLMDSDFYEQIGVHQSLVDCADAEEGFQDRFQRQLLMRQFAKEAYMKANASMKIRKSMLRKSVPLRGPYRPGDLVAFKKKDKWLGPARVLPNEGRSSLWLVHGGVTILVAETSCRPATSDEVS